MSPRCLFPALLLLTGPLAVSAAPETKPDKELAAMEVRLQADRATAIRARLAVYTDELQKLATLYTAAGEEEDAGLVMEELKTVQADMEQLDAIAKGTVRFPDPPAGKEAEPPATQAAKKINGIIARFTKAKADAPAPPGRNVPAGAPRMRQLKMEKALRPPEARGTEGSASWKQEGTYAVWTLDDLAPGDYEISLRYSGPKSGGTATITLAKQTFSVTVPAGEKGQGSRELKVAGVFKVKEPGVDIRVECTGVPKTSDYLWNLQSVVLQPAGKHP